MSVRASLKRTVEGGVVLSGLAGLSRRRRRGETLILAYHNVVPRGEPPAGDRSLHLPQDAFAAQLDALRHTHDVVPLDAVLDEPEGDGRPRAVITFDDAYRGAVTAGVEELAARGLPATIFVAPAFVGGRDFWWDALTPDGAEELDPALRERALDELRGEDASVRRWAADAGRRARRVPGHAECASEAELRAACAGGLVTLGSHSWSHPNLARLEGEALESELALPLAWLRERFGRVAPGAVSPVSSTLSYPYGRSSAAVERAAAAAGYRAGFRIDGGWMRAPGAPFALPRLNVPAGLSRHGFVLRAAGLFCR